MQTLQKTPGKSKRPAVRKRVGLPEKLAAVSAQSNRVGYDLRLYVSGSTLKSARAIENIKRICEQHLKDRYNLEVIDVYQQMDMAREDQIVAVPALIRRCPLPLRRLIGDLSDTTKVLLSLDLKRPE